MDRHPLTRRSLVGAGLGLGGAAMTAAATGASLTGASLTGALAQAASPPAVPPKPGALTVAPTSQAGLGPRLTMHAIDNFHGTPASGMVCDLLMHDGADYKPVKTVTTTATGRPADPILVDGSLKTGRYELLLHFEAYFAKLGVALPTPNFLGIVPIRFVIRDAGQRYHLPVLFTPWGYSYYRGS